MHVCDSMADSRGTAPRVPPPPNFFLKDLPPPRRSSVFPPLSEAKVLESRLPPPQLPLGSTVAWFKRTFLEIPLSLAWPRALEECAGDNIRKFSRGDLFFCKVQESNHPEVVYRDLEIFPPANKGSIT